MTGQSAPYQAKEEGQLELTSAQVTVLNPGFWVGIFPKAGTQANPSDSLKSKITCIISLPTWVPQLQGAGAPKFPKALCLPVPTWLIYT